MHISKLKRTLALVKKFSWTAFCLPLGLFFTAPTALASAELRNSELLSTYIDELARRHKAMMGISVHHRGKPLFDYFSGQADHIPLIVGNLPKSPDSETRYKVGSVTKLFIATATMQLVEQGKLSLNRPISDFFPSIPNARNITINHLITHSSGLFNHIQSKDFSEYYFEPQSHSEMISRIAKYKPVFDPGTQYEYSNTNYLLLGYILEWVTDQPLDALITNQIAAPLRLTNTQFCNKWEQCEVNSQSYYYADSDWHSVTPWAASSIGGAGALVSTPKELNRFIEALFNQELITTTSLNLLKPKASLPHSGVQEMHFYNQQGFGYTGWIEGYYSLLVYFPEKSLSVAITINGTHTPITPLSKDLMGLILDVPEVKLALNKQHASKSGEEPSLLAKIYRKLEGRNNRMDATLGQLESTGY
ncbi:serine hydrolase domain-containing protein [Vibrio sonorensis]|uniref:serine hydrolase domain-containing protein n=1 Tax=Vibrio sonorensis TaxID=1004316 RepID=UPI0008D9C1A0|nr:serine hydrolase domain-containing protein [Vibrio sonorensis]